MHVVLKHNTQCTPRGIRLILAKRPPHKTELHKESLEAPKMVFKTLHKNSFMELSATIPTVFGTYLKSYISRGLN